MSYYNNNSYNQGLNSNSLQFYTMNKLTQENGEIEFANGQSSKAPGSLGGSHYGNNQSHYYANNSGNSGGHQGLNSNAPRKSPFNIINEQSDHGFNKTNYNNDISTGSMMSSSVHGNSVLMESEKMQVSSSLSSSSLDNVNLNSMNGIISVIKLLNPKLIWSGNSASNANVQSSSEDCYDDILNEPPLLEELGIDPLNILKYMKCVMLFRSIGDGKEVEWDMAGPILLIGCLGFFLLLAGKIHFGYIYGIGILSCIGTYILLNIMSNNQAIDLYTTMSILGYSLLPIVILAGISVVFSLRTKIGIAMAIFFNMWSTITASRFFEYTVSLKHQRYLIAYPIALLYACFTIVTIF
ncbi:Yip1p like integral membrane protein [Cryptosporidium ryanae]|uniref:Yip1p like integral membrane protein n=1 Tax=Cryptosporidium ryanae TaxID=515981 RepID=UPI003519EA00|nr:Yip1p like integral membrane protein [Cryptosporidium ryanae]